MKQKVQLKVGFFFSLFADVETKKTFSDVDDTPDEHTGGDSSKSNSVTSEHSVHSVGVSASSQSSSTNSLPAGNFFSKLYYDELQT